MTSSPPIIVAFEDHSRLQELLARVPATELTDQLEAELDRARVVPLSEVPGDVVVMDSEVEYEDVATNHRRRLQLVYPVNANSDSGRISILAPLGSALLGLRVQQEIDWPMPGGLRRVRVLSVSRPS